MNERLQYIKKLGAINKHNLALSRGKSVELEFDMDLPISVTDLKSMLNSNWVMFGYFKKNGQYRIFTGTRNTSLMPGYASPKGGGNKSNNLKFFDRIVRGWRSLAKDEYMVVLMEVYTKI